ncbi:MAG TPA: glycosyltransferase family 1 protein [Candidatus Desulfaltia sp.]|nr:glycosyltransferase family 1 protein [Candidatus Desulfaltia sp.]
MRLGFDLRPFLREETGVGTYLRNLLFHLARIDATNEYFLLSSSWKDRFPAEKIPPFVRMRFHDLRLPVKLLNALWQKQRRPSLDLFFRTKLDLTHSATPLILPTRGKRIITVHDLFFMDFPEMAGEEAGRMFFRLAAASFRNADGILTFSNFTSVELISRFALEEKKVKVVSHGLDKRFLEEVPAAELKATRKRCKLPPAFLLFVGAQVPRKNLVRFLEALKIVHLHGIRIPLVLIGPGGEDTEAIRLQAEKLGLGHWVMMAGYLDEEDVRQAYRLATAFVFPSLCEGFGLPLVEAMASGVPVAASQTSAIPEVCRDAAVYFRPESPESMAEKVVSVIEDGELRKKLIARGKERAGDFSWEKAATETLEFYERVVQGL